MPSNAIPSRTPTETGRISPVPLDECLTDIVHDRTPIRQDSLPLRDRRQLERCRDCGVHRQRPVESRVDDELQALALAGVPQDDEFHRRFTKLVDRSVDHEGRSGRERNRGLNLCRYGTPTRRSQICASGLPARTRRAAESSSASISNAPLSTSIATNSRSWSGVVPGATTRSKSSSPSRAISDRVWVILFTRIEHSLNGDQPVTLRVPRQHRVTGGGSTSQPNRLSGE